MSETARPYDLAIVGASFAGLVAARTAAMRGLSVAVLEAKPEAGHRVATTGILVKEAAEEIDIPHTLTRRVHGVRLYAPSHEHVDLFAPGYFFLTTDTANLLRWLAREAMRAGAKILYRARFEGAERVDGLFRFKGSISPRAIFWAPTAHARPSRAISVSAATSASSPASRSSTRASHQPIRASFIASWIRGSRPAISAGSRRARS